jgi:dienelactone hydrolase
VSDIFGIYPNAQLLADEFANNGYLTIIPDIFQGDVINVNDMVTGKANLPAWLPNHQPAHVEPPIVSTLKYIRETLGVKKVGAVGYCFGGKVCTYNPDLKIKSPKLKKSGANYIGLVRLSLPQAWPD